MTVPIDEAQVHFWLVMLVFVLAVPTFALLLRVNAPYGRFSRSGWGPTLPARTAWMFFESPAVVVFALVYFMGQNAWQSTPLVLLGIWQFHYVVRTVVYPLRMREPTRRVPWVIAAMAILFNVLNAYINARWISQFGSYPDSWLLSMPFVSGLALFITGWAINQRADSVLIGLRQSGDKHYAIPQGGLYRHISCPNYFGEILAWLGWAILTWSLAGAAFAIFTAANLLPRAIATHRWYREAFPGYPSDRKAVIPFLV